VVSRRRLRWWHWLVAAVSLVLVAAVAVLWPPAATYQPVQFGGASGGSAGVRGLYPGMPSAATGRLVNNFGGQQGEIYVAPRRGAFTIIESIVNTGPQSVTIEAVSAVLPGQLGLGWPLTNAGTAMWALFEPSPGLPRGAEACSYSKPCSVPGLSLAPGEDISVAFPVRFTTACYQKDVWAGADSFYVEERFGPFTHWVKLQLGTPLLFNQPEPVGTGPDVTCPSP
jgi:hypothetical protein